MRVSRCTTLPSRIVPKMVPLLPLETGPDRRELTAARHSEKSAAFPGRWDGPVKGMTSRDSAAVPQFGLFLGVRRIG
jgi:hypothetical protein